MRNTLGLTPLGPALSAGPPPEPGGPGAATGGSRAGSLAGLLTREAGRLGVLGCAACVLSAALAPGAVTTGALADGAVTSAKLAARVLPAAGWALAGNAGTYPATQFLGTTDGQPLEVRVGGARVLRLEPQGPLDPTFPAVGTGPNVLGGLDLNSIAAGVVGATVAGGGVTGGNCACPNRITGSLGTVGGGANNQAGFLATVAGGVVNTASDMGSVGGGESNRAEGSSSTIAGGRLHTASGSRSSIGGGDFNSASATLASIGGGGTNTASGDQSTIGGGVNNTASSSGSTVGGGDSNRAEGSFSTVPGGAGALARLHGQFAHAAGRFTVSGDAQGSVYVLRGVTAPGGTAVLSLDGASFGGERLTILDKQAIAFHILIVGRSATEAAAYQSVGILNRQGDDTGVFDLTTEVFENDQSWGVAVSQDDTSESLKITVTGDSDEVVRWVAVVRTAEVIGP